MIIKPLFAVIVAKSAKTTKRAIVRFYYKSGQAERRDTNESINQSKL
jgi:hypothetical protein